MGMVVGGEGDSKSEGRRGVSGGGRGGGNSSKRGNDGESGGGRVST